LYLEIIVLKCSRANVVHNISPLVDVSVNAEEFRQILDVVEGAKEDKARWSAFLNHLKDRGLERVGPVVSDDCSGLMESACEHFPATHWERCV
jgi:transposase-like protein